MSEAAMDFVKRDTTDVKEGYITLSSATTSAYDTARSLDPGTTPSVKAECKGRRNAEIRVFSDASAGAVTFAIKAWPYERRDEVLAETTYPGKGWTVYSGVWTCSGSTTIEKNPLTGANDPGVTWYEASTDTTNTHVAGNQVLMFPASGTTATSYEKRMMIDTHACKWIAAEVTNIATGTKALIGLRFTD